MPTGEHTADKSTGMTDIQPLLDAVVVMSDNIKALNETLKSDYPKRAEIRRSRRQFALYIVLGLFMSSLVTIGTVSGCFLSKQAVDGEAPFFCAVLPGYSEAQDRNRRITKRFNQLLHEIASNKKDINRLQRRVAR